MFGNSFLRVWRILPLDLSCPGGKASWEKVDVEDRNRVCRGQIDVCNRTGQMCKFLSSCFWWCPKCLIFITAGPQPSPVPRTLCVLPTAPASSNAAVLTTTMGISVSGRSVLKKNVLWIQDDAQVIIFNLYLYRVSSPPSWCLGLLEFLQLWCLSCCGSPRDVRSNKAEWKKHPRICYAAFF